MKTTASASSMLLSLWLYDEVDSPWRWLWSCCCCRLCCCCWGFHWHLHELCPKARGGTQVHRAESFPETESRTLPLCSEKRRSIIINTLGDFKLLNTDIFPDKMRPRSQELIICEPQLVQLWARFFSYPPLVQTHSSSSARQCLAKISSCNKFIHNSLWMLHFGKYFLKLKAQRTLVKLHATNQAIC